MESVEDCVMRIIDDHSFVLVNVSPNLSLVDDLDYDSLDIVNLELSLKEEFQNPQISLNHPKTVQDVIDQVKKYISI